MQQRFVVLVALLTSSLTSCEDVVLLPAYDYNYATSNLLNVADRND